MRTRTATADETAATRPVRGSAHAVLGWSLAVAVGAVVLLLLPVVQPAPVETLLATDLAGRRDMAGFYEPETDAAGNTFVWANREVTAAFDLTSRKPLTLLLDLRSAATAGGPDAPVIVRVNGQEVGIVRPETRNYDFSQFRIRVPSSSTPLLRVTLIATGVIAPRPDDGRTLAVMVRSLSLDRSEAWSTIARRAWLYWLVPLCVAAVAGAAGLSRSVRRGVVAQIAGYTAIGAAGVGAAAMLVATALLLGIGELDRGAYYLWLFGSAYLAAVFVAVALALPLGAPGASSLWQRVAQSAPVRRHAARWQLAGGVALLLGVFLVSVGLFTYYGTGDVDRKLKWMNNVRVYGVVDAYAGIPDQYPPLTLVILAAADRAGDALRLSDFAAFKLSLLLFVALTAAVFLWMTRHMLLTAAMTLALLPNAMALGYTDIYFAPPLLGALWALRGRRWVAFSLCLALACLIKWQAAILAPPLLLAAVRLAGELDDANDITPVRPRIVRRLAAIALPGAAMTAVVLLVFGGAVVASLVKGFGERFLSANALNANWLLTQLLHAADPRTFPGRGTIQSTDLRLTLLPKLLFLVAYGVALAHLARGKITFARAVGWSLAAYLAYFAFNTGVHENHLFPAILLAAVLAAETGAWGRVVFALVALAANLNLVLFYGLRGEPLIPPLLGPLDSSVPLTALVVALIVTYFVVLSRRKSVG